MLNLDSHYLELEKESSEGVSLRALQFGSDPKVHRLDQASICLPSNLPPDAILISRVGQCV